MEWNKDKSIVRYEYGNRNIFYSPIGRCMVLAEEGQEASPIFQALTDYVPIHLQKKVRKPEDYTLLTVLPNNTCNFSCSYCYSASGRNKSVLEWEKLRVAIDYFINSKPDGFSKPLSISFMGGGEPMLSWDTVKNAILYAKESASVRGFRLRISLITNGSILTDDIVGFLIDNEINVSVSFEILPEIQNLQRKNYELVSGNILKLCSAGIPVQLNSTITKANVERMTEMLQTVTHEFPEVKNLMFEYATGEALYDSPEDLRSFFNSYIKGFHKCLMLAEEHDIELTSFAFLRTVYPLERACPGEFCITADGFITGCYCVGSPLEKLFGKTKYGTVTADGIEFDLNVYESLINENLYSKAECEECPVKWNCGGGCFHQFNTHSKAFRDVICDFTREFVKMITIYRIKRYMLKHPEVSLPALIRI